MSAPAFRIETVPPQPTAIDPQVTALQTLLKLEESIRQIGSVDELAFLAANDVRRLVKGRQAFVFRRAGATWQGATWQVAAVSSLASVDRSSLAIQWVEGIAADLGPSAEAQDFALPAHADPQMPETATYPFPFMLWQPLRLREGEPFAALLIVREQAWTASERTLAARIGGTLAHGWAALDAPASFKARAKGGWQRHRRMLLALAAGVAAAALVLIKVPMTALAPAEVVPLAPGIISAPVDGVLADVLIDPGAHVRKGDVLALYVDTAERGALDVAEREVGVAEAALKRIGQTAFQDPQARRDLTAAEADVQLKRAERDFARDRLARGRILAPRDGIAVFPDKRELIGRPVQTGQRLMDIANGADVQVKAMVSVDDTVLVEPGTRLRLFLDSDPMRPLDATVTRAALAARTTESNTLAFQVHAALKDGQGAVPRLGSRGTAQLYGEQVMLGYYLLRKPITAFRQKFGL